MDDKDEDGQTDKFGSCSRAQKHRRDEAVYDGRKAQWSFFFGFAGAHIQP